MDVFLIIMYVNKSALSFYSLSMRFSSCATSVHKVEVTICLSAIRILIAQHLDTNFKRPYAFLSVSSQIDFYSRELGFGTMPALHFSSDLPNCGTVANPKGKRY